MSCLVSCTESVCGEWVTREGLRSLIAADTAVSSESPRLLVAPAFSRWDGTSALICSTYTLASIHTLTEMWVPALGLLA
jgi:hypothetical protein